MQVAVGDVIYIEANSGAVKRVGRCDAFATEFDLEAEEYVPLPKGEVHKKKEIVQVCFLWTAFLLICFFTICEVLCYNTSSWILTLPCCMGLITITMYMNFKFSVLVNTYYREGRK